MVWRDTNDLFGYYGNKKKIKMKKVFLFLPIIIILIIFSFLFIFLLQNKDPGKPPSALLNKKIPTFSMVNLFDKNETLSNINLKEKIILINFFASWCAPCKEEHALFFGIKKQHPNLYIIGINHKDKAEDALKYLNTDGNPYDYVGIDNKGSLGLEFGVVGLPETFLVNKSGQIIYKYIGPLTKKVIKSEIKILLK